MSAYFWAAFPFDNLCEEDDTFVTGDSYIGNHTLFQSGKERSETLQISVGESKWRYCSQDTFESIVGAYLFEMKVSWS